MSLEFQITDNSGAFKAAKEEAVQRAMESVGLHLAVEASDELENSPRRVDTGRLKGSINYRVITNGVEVGTDVEYGVYVHFGTRKMEANAFLKNAFERNMDQVQEYIIRELKG